MKSSIEYAMTTEDGLIIRNSDFIDAYYLAIYFNGKRLTQGIDYYSASSDSTFIFCDDVVNEFRETGSDVYFIVDWE